MSQISWGLSQQNRRTLVIGGHELTKKQETKNGNIHWKSSRWGSHKCKTTSITRENDLISCRNEHTHEVFPGRSDARLLVQKMKQDTKIQQIPVNSIIIANGLQSVSEEKAVQLALPCRSAINRALNRQKVNDRPTLPPIVDRLCSTERAALNAFASHHTGALLKGCYFLLCQAFNRKINEVGLKRLYETNHDLNLSLRLIPALSFVPVEMVNAAFDLVIEEIKNVSDKFDLDDNITQKLDEVASYFQRTYIKGETIGRNSREPLFPVNLWNHSEEAAAGLIRTTNAVEGWHLGVATLFKGNHPSVHTFLEQIKTGCCKSEI